ncbi:MAG: DNA polymerase IV [Peptococcaceae bacterium]|jgi:DNA polymerase-4|nr:DNA polymerase IV [Peptococcaceae bacterium]
MENAPKNRQIIHVDMDAFYASVEQRDNPELRGKPVVVGGKPNSRGVVSTCSYEARKFGVRSAMPISEAHRRCPHAIFLPPNFEKYHQASEQLHKIFQDYTPLVEPLSLDEAFLDVTASLSLFGPAEKIAMEIKNRIKKELNLTASIGLAPNKFLAKIASDIQKPDGFVIVREEQIEAFLDPLPIERVWGVGPKTAEQLHRLNVRTVRDLKKLDKLTLHKLLGQIGSQLYYLARGIDDRPVEPEREVKSIGREITFQQDLTDSEILKTYLLDLSLDVGRRLRKAGLKARTISLKIRLADFKTISRSKTLNNYTDLDKEIYREASMLLNELKLHQPVRLIGVTAHNLSCGESQQSLFATEPGANEKLTKTLDKIKERFGEDSITLARLLKQKDDGSK